MEITPAAKHATAIALTMALLMASCGDKAMQHKNGRYTVNTTTIAPDVIGYNGPTPLLIHISNDKVESIEVLENGEPLTASTSAFMASFTVRPFHRVSSSSSMGSK